ncbi:pyridoxal phosphate-dependent transferase [Rhodocollybia butyracea]|uniref:Pyridoxal phosphate-dependent transferase n=1 Tax=Rhodocollybia butyracea TaxID=206335 RepID=A0A9P5UF55_9AGAR|nr:pyridoxal phosphate-dependent transferase [Rhodocollybia butyracea]
MSLLFKNLRIHQIFGANTNVGKTILTTALVRASASNQSTFYLKPVSTGPAEDADDGHVQRYTDQWKDRVFTECLYRYQHPVSPHLAVKLAAATPPSNETFVNSIANHIRKCAEQGYGNMYVETAGGVHSPTLSGLPQADAYRPLFLPTILIGDANLGGISTTISAYEALILRGYIVDSVLMFNDPSYGNAEYLSKYFAERGVRLDAFLPPPPDKDYRSTAAYYDSLLLSSTLSHLDTLHSTRIAELETMPQRTRDVVWWPFVQHAMLDAEVDSGQANVNVIDSAYGDFFNVLNSPSSATSSILQPQLDGSASWWTQTFGHTSTRLTLAAAQAAGRYGHVMFPRSAHAPALQLAEYLVSPLGPGSNWASRVFFSDNGSTGMEVALKMALRTFSRRVQVSHPTSATRAHQRRLGILGLKGSYHGDTIGTMDACEESGVYTCEWHDCKGYWFDPPRVIVRNGKVYVEVPGEQEEVIKENTTRSELKPQLVTFPSLADIYDVPARLGTSLYTQYTSYISRTLWNLNHRLHEGQEGGMTELAALVLEPLLLGAGGMIFVDPLFQRALVDVVRSPGLFPQEDLAPLPHPLPIIFDEVFTGFHRLGPLTPQTLLGPEIHPDIAVYAKMLTGGLVPMAVTLATKEVFDAFYYSGDNEGGRTKGGKKDSLLHGHSYTAHAVGCGVAREAVAMMPSIVGGEEHASMRDVWGKSEGMKSNSEIRIEQSRIDERGSWRQPVKRQTSYSLPKTKDELSHEALHATATQIYSLWHPSFISDVSRMNIIEDVMALGTVLAIKLKEDVIELKNVDGSGARGEGYTSTSAETVFRALLQIATSDSPLTTPTTPSGTGAPYSIHFRTLGNVAYFMTSLNTNLETVKEVEERIWEVLQDWN